MAQIFHPMTNTISKASIVLLLLALGAAGWAAPAWYRSSWVTDAGVVRDQPVPFSHKHHVLEIGIDCRYCHTSVETSSFAGLPPTRTCMQCHTQVWSDSPMLEPVRRSFRTGESLTWTRVHDLPDFVYFNHGIHVAKGIGCATCHGRVDEMPLMWKEATLWMEWCLSCHRDPARYVRPRDKVFDMTWQRPEDYDAQAAALVRDYGIETAQNCSDCHR